MNFFAFLDVMNVNRTGPRKVAKAGSHDDEATHLQEISTMKKTLFAVALLSLFASASFAQAAPGDTQWQKTHPRREQVNNRLANQNHRIGTEVREGEMSQAKAARLHRNDRRIRQEERDMAAQHGGHLTGQEQRVLNHQENTVGRRIRR